MPALDFALLCDAATIEGGVVSLLRGGIDRVIAPQFPLRFVVNLAARITWAEEDLGQVHVVRVRVVHADGEELANVEGVVQPERLAEMVPDLPVAAAMVVPLPLEVRRLGRYSVELTADGDTLKSFPLSVHAAVPQV